MSLRFLPPRHERIQAVVLDWAGTTLDFGSRAPVITLVRIFARQGVTLTLEEARGPMGRAKRDHIQALLALPSIAAQWQSLHGANPDDAAVDRLFADFGPVQREIISEFSTLIPGCREAIDALRARGIKIGSSTGYSREQMDVVEPLAAAQGYAPDAAVCASDIAPGRPAPWMIFENARRLGVYPMRTVVKVDDTPVGIEAGVNAGCWNVGISAAGNQTGLSPEELAALPPAERARLVARAADALYAAGAHLVIESIAELPAAIDAIEARLREEARNAV
jgi:phosphonoacetaldehyde hydrolase